MFFTQVDFVRASNLSSGGKSIITFPSLNKRGTINRIVSKLNEGASVITSQNDVHYVVIEFGIANLRGKTVRQSAKASINIAHPDFHISLKKILIKPYHKLIINWSTNRA